MEQAAELLELSGRWRSREVAYWAGTWSRLKGIIPTFTTEPFRSHADAPANPHMRAVVRQPVAVTEHPIPVGVVSNTYALAQHCDVVERCLAGLRQVGLDPSQLKCEIGLTALGEWMQFRATFPDSYSYVARDGNKLTLKLECSNSVDGSSRLVILLTWFRLICSNGLAIRETRAELRDAHDANLDLDSIPKIIARAMAVVEAEKQRLSRLDTAAVAFDALREWADGVLAARWGKKAACRAFHICLRGEDVEISDPFAKGAATEKPVQYTGRVPGAPITARTLFDVTQALSWIATQRVNTEERMDWQSAIPELIEELRKRTPAVAGA